MHQASVCLNVSSRKRKAGGYLRDNKNKKKEERKEKKSSRKEDRLRRRGGKKSAPHGFSQIFPGLSRGSVAKEQVARQQVSLSSPRVQRPFLLLCYYLVAAGPFETSSLSSGNIWAMVFWGEFSQMRFRNIPGCP